MKLTLTFERFFAGSFFVNCQTYHDQHALRYKYFLYSWDFSVILKGAEVWLSSWFLIMLVQRRDAQKYFILETDLLEMFLHVVQDKSL